MHLAMKVDVVSASSNSKMQTLQYIASSFSHRNISCLERSRVHAVAAMKLDAITFRSFLKHQQISFSLSIFANSEPREYSVQT